MINLGKLKGKNCEKSGFMANFHTDLALEAFDGQGGGDLPGVHVSR